jgi:hypothetical protein
MSESPDNEVRFRRGGVNGQGMFRGAPIGDLMMIADTNVH